MLKILVHSDDHITEVEEKVMKMYKPGFKFLVIKSTTEIPENISDKYDYKKISEMFDEED